MDNKESHPILAHQTESDSQSRPTMISEIQSTVLEAVARARTSGRSLASVGHDDIPTTVVDPSPSTATKSAPKDNATGGSVISQSTAPTSTSDHNEPKQDGGEQKHEPQLDFPTICECQGQCDVSHTELVPPIKYDVSLSNASRLDALASSSLERKRSAEESSKAVHTTFAKELPAESPPVDAAFPHSTSNTAVSYPSSSLKRVSVASSPFSSNKADDGSDVSSHRTSGNYQVSICDDDLETLLHSTGNEHLTATVAPVEEFDAHVDRTFLSKPEPNMKDAAVSTGVSYVGAPSLQRREKQAAPLVPENSIIQRPTVEQKMPRLSRRRVLITTLALAAMATCILQPKLPSK
ncbi:MAG: hypothetical protein M1822_000327 [Bathelium mastoideum]|nr:MAG: hypothetical protein M1822_000327 [Bathelium mastoideum]